MSLDEIAKLVVSPGGLDEARRRLAELRIDPAAAVLVERTAGAVGASMVAGVANVKVDGVQHDLVVLNNGFVFVADPGRADGGKRRLRTLVGSVSPVELARRNWFLPYEEIASASVSKEVPTCASVDLMWVGSSRCRSSGAARCSRRRAATSFSTSCGRSARTDRTGPTR